MTQESIVGTGGHVPSPPSSHPVATAARLETGVDGLGREEQIQPRTLSYASSTASKKSSMPSSNDTPSTPTEYLSPEDGTINVNAVPNQSDDVVDDSDDNTATATSTMDIYHRISRNYDLRPTAVTIGNKVVPELVSGHHSDAGGTYNGIDGGIGGSTRYSLERYQGLHGGRDNSTLTYSLHAVANGLSLAHGAYNIPHAIPPRDHDEQDSVDAASAAASDGHSTRSAWSE